MKQYNKVIGEVFEDDEVQGRYIREERLSNVICMTMEELEEIWKAAEQYCSNLEFGHYAIPFQEYLKSKGINTNQ